jgi:hypothetical protein
MSRETNQEGESEGSGPPQRPGVMEEVSPPELLAVQLQVPNPAIEPVLEILTPATDNHRTTRLESKIVLEDSREDQARNGDSADWLCGPSDQGLAEQPASRAAGLRA